MPGIVSFLLKQKYKKQSPANFFCEAGATFCQPYHVLAYGGVYYKNHQLKRFY